jgi:hypothetical protein
MSVLSQYEAFLAANTATSLAYRQMIANFTVGSGDDAIITPFALLGGAVRDIYENGASATPRDFDIVVDAPIGDLRKLGKYGNRKASTLNGFQVTHEGIKFDLWCLRETHAIRTASVGDKTDPTFASLMPTTFLTLEALAIETRGKLAGEATPNPPRIVHEGGFQQAWDNDLLQVNNPNNPFPIIQMVRVAGFVKRLGFTLATNLEDWILAHKDVATRGVLYASGQTLPGPGGFDVAGNPHSRWGLQHQRKPGPIRWGWYVGRFRLQRGSPFGGRLQRRSDPSSCWEEHASDCSIKVLRRGQRALHLGRNPSHSRRSYRCRRSPSLGHSRVT